MKEEEQTRGKRNKKNGTTICKRSHFVHNAVMNSKPKMQAKYNKKEGKKIVHM